MDRLDTTSQNDQVDGSDRKVVTRSVTGSASQKNISEKNDESDQGSQKMGRRLASLDDEMYPAVLDSNRPRDEWNISHVQPETQPALVVNEAIEKTLQQQIVTTHESEFVALNNVLKDHINTQSDGEQDFVFPNRNNQSQPVSALLADDMMIREIGSEQKTSGTTSTEKKPRTQDSSELEKDMEEVKISMQSDDKEQ